MERLDIPAFVRLYNDCMLSTSSHDAEIRRQMKSAASDFFDAIPRETVADLVSMYMLTRALIMYMPSDKDDVCSEMFFRLIPPYLGSPQMKLPERLQMDILRCIAFEMGNDTGGYLYDDCVKYYEAVCTGWLARLNSENAWTGMDPHMAAERLQILADGVEIFGLDALRHPTARAYGHYHNLTTL